MDAFKPYLAKAATGAALTREEARAAFDDLLSGEVTPAQAGGFLMALRVRGEAVDEIIGAVSAMRGRMLRVEAPAGAIDMVGTGGDESGSYNISTLAAMIVAGCGVPVAKHGNRAASSKSGAADVLTALGVKIGLDPADLARCICARRPVLHVRPDPPRLHAPRGAGAGRTGHAHDVQSARAALQSGRRLAPAARRVLETWLEPLAQALKELGSERVWTVHGSDGLDEITTTGPTHVAALENGAMRTLHDRARRRSASPARGPRTFAAAIRRTTRRQLRAVLEGERTPYRDIAASTPPRPSSSPARRATCATASTRAAQAVDCGAARAALDRLVAVSNG